MREAEAIASARSTVLRIPIRGYEEKNGEGAEHEPVSYESL